MEDLSSSYLNVISEPRSLLRQTAAMGAAGPGFRRRTGWRHWQTGTASGDPTGKHAELLLHFPGTTGWAGWRLGASDQQFRLVL